MSKTYLYLFQIIFLVITSVASFYAGLYYSKILKSKEVVVNNSEKGVFNGKIYSINYPWNWTFEGPSEGPITGFPEFSKLISPSGDMQIVIGLKGDNRFEFIHDDIQQTTEPTNVKVGDKVYSAEEQFLDINEDPEYNVAILEVELSDKRLIGYTDRAREIFLPMKIQMLYRFSGDGIPFEDKLKIYEEEKKSALQILETFRYLEGQN